jgi:hypothetical protein
MAESLAQVAQPAVGFIYQDQGIRICHNAAIVWLFCATDFIHDKNAKSCGPLLVALVGAA